MVFLVLNWMTLYRIWLEIIWKGSDLQILKTLFTSKTFL